MDSRSDEELIEAANRGDTEAFGELYRRYRDWVMRIALRHCGGYAEALDVLQETFIYLLGKFPGFRLAAKMTTFLYPVVTHLAQDRQRRSRQTAAADVLALDLPDPRSPAGASADAADDARIVAGAVARLTEGQREVLLMRFVDDMALEDIAVALDLPLGTMKSRLHHALAKLRENPQLRTYFLPEP